MSERIFRGLVRRWAPDALLFTEMVNATSLGLGHGLIKVEELAGERRPIDVQLLDHRPAAMAEAAGRAKAAGAFLIDISMDCPVKKIARKPMGWTCQGFPGAAGLCHALMRAPTAAAAREFLEQAGSCLAGRKADEMHDGGAKALDET